MLLHLTSFHHPTQREEAKEAEMAEMLRNTHILTDASGCKTIVRSRSSSTLASMRRTRQAAASFARHTRCLRHYFGLRKRQVVLYVLPSAACRHPRIVACSLGAHLLHAYPQNRAFCVSSLTPQVLALSAGVAAARCHYVPWDAPQSAGGLASGPCSVRLWRTARCSSLRVPALTSLFSCL